MVRFASILQSTCHAFMHTSELAQPREARNCPKASRESDVPYAYRQRPDRGCYKTEPCSGVAGLRGAPEVVDLEDVIREPRLLLVVMRNAGARLGGEELTGRALESLDLRGVDKPLPLCDGRILVFHEPTKS